MISAIWEVEIGRLNMGGPISTNKPGVVVYISVILATRDM
jgi:hypothetical protein